MQKIIKSRKKALYLLAFMGLAFVSCELDEIQDPNGLSLAETEQNAILGVLNELVVGVQSSARNGIGIETTASGTIARELYLFDADPRNTGDLLGKDGSALNNNSFYSTAQWNGNYRSIKNANILLNALDNTNAITETEKNGYRGFAKTFQAYEFIQILKSYGQARIDVADEENLGAILDFDAAIAEVRTLLNEALTDLNNAGDTFLFPIAGFSDLVSDTDTGLSVSDFIEFNRAVAAVAALYDGDGDAALTALQNSYFDLNGSLAVGPRFLFSLGAGDRANPVFRSPSESAESPNNGDQIIVHNSWINDAEPNDLRVAEKAALRPSPSVQDGLNGTHETRLYASNLSSIDILRNEELVLVYAEANILTNNLPEAVVALDVIRTSANLPVYLGAITTEALTDEMLTQRRYSLWSENHRLFDLRRYNRINETVLPIDREGDRLFEVLPIPLSENAD
ncbi:RagB/SusD family nutrient uptake outer membrane protein [Aquimarina celericrescens]|uniref:RagB/SusD family nutrient uptake outer membrane protein n=1 Tax=Aquimarina celericrescens TaxID=1964542 RepID=A0ABW5AVL9_9FLAO|nr:RagB/SusD family nutrient uptake outer membrane protein [Aquimarina celericrescens]